MRKLLILAAGAMVAGCASSKPDPNPNMAWVDLFVEPGYVLTAEQVDGASLEDGRYFEVSPGQHVLTVSFKFNIGAAAGGTAGSAGGSGTTQVCYYDLPYGKFKAGKQYFINARKQADSGEVGLYDSADQAQKSPLARGQNERCAPR